MSTIKFNIRVGGSHNYSGIVGLQREREWWADITIEASDSRGGGGEIAVDRGS